MALSRQGDTLFKLSDAHLHLLRLKRKVVEQRHREILDGFYKDTVARL
ncbi:MAG TPA: hypothetical protein VFC23_05470 [Thermoanaerobaculia bacterium]|nr:hypothetical protein [Thermoanaerobaculia bacterium]